MNVCMLQHIHVIMMLSLNSFITLLTWTPYMVPLLRPSILPPGSSALYGLVANSILMSNCFSTPTMYLICSRDYRVSGLHLFFFH